MVKRRQKLPGAPRNIVLFFKDFDELVDRYFEAGLEVGTFLPGERRPA